MMHQFFFTILIFPVKHKLKTGKKLSRGGVKMKTKVTVSILSLFFTGIMIISGCATTSRITEPANAESTLLVGRIMLTCTDFPKQWHINGEHASGIEVDLRNVSLNKVITAKARGYDGMFHIINPDFGEYKIERFAIETGGSRYRVNLQYVPHENTFITVERNAVNNLGDIEWYETCETEESKEYTSTGTQTTLITTESHNYRRNYAELKSWFVKTYPESGWNNMNWNSLDYVSK
jgi:hypothetical protein